MSSIFKRVQVLGNGTIHLVRKKQFGHSNCIWSFRVLKSSDYPNPWITKSARCPVRSLPHSLSTGAMLPQSTECSDYLMRCLYELFSGYIHTIYCIIIIPKCLLILGWFLKEKNSCRAIVSVCVVAKRRWNFRNMHFRTFEGNFLKNVCLKHILLLISSMDTK